MSKIKLNTIEQEQVVLFAKALANPMRVAILQLLQSHSCCYHCDMAEELPIAKSTLSQHLNELKSAGLIKGELNPPTVKYCIDKKNWDKARKLFSSFFKDTSLMEDC